VDGAKSWVGINQTAVNKYVEHFFRKGLLSEIVGGGNDILREQKIGNSRLDFRIHNTYVEVKMPLMYLPCAVSDAPIPERNVSNFERFVRHVGDLSNSLSANKKAILLLCFIYDAPVFQAPKPNKKNETIRNAVYKSLRSGVQMWQLNMGIAPQGVNLLKYFDITPLFL
jgi:sugar fermentation stimulation protein A